MLYVLFSYYKKCSKPTDVNFPNIITYNSNYYYFFYDRNSNLNSHTCIF